MSPEQLMSTVLETMALRTSLPTPAHAHEAVLFDLDGVLTSTTELHAACWKQSFAPFDADREYVEHLDGRPRHAGVRAFLDARGLPAPEGTPDDVPGTWSVHGIANAKQWLVDERLSRDGVTAYPGSVRWVRALRRDGVRTAVVSSSANCSAVLHAAGILGLFETTVGGDDLKRLRLRGKPAPDGFLEAADRLGADPARTIVVEDAVAGVAAGRRGGFGLVVGVARNAAPAELRAAGAHLVIDDLSEMLS
jgi:alpha,alpha-trehalose phosphorylase